MTRFAVCCIINWCQKQSTLKGKGLAMSNSPIKELLDKALAAELIEEEDAAFARDTCQDLVEVIEWFYSHIYASESGDPEEILREWGFLE